LAEAIFYLMFILCIGGCPGLSSPLWLVFVGVERAVAWNEESQNICAMKRHKKVTETG
jgi:hypothetical protein